MIRGRAALRFVLAAAALATAIAAAAGAGASAAKEFTPDCRARTALAPRPHVLTFRVRCNFEALRIAIDPSTEVRKVRHKTSLVHPDPEDGFHCRRDKADASCQGRAGSGTTVVGAMRVRGERCSTDTRFGVQGGVDCDPPAQACIKIGYASGDRDRQPRGC
ncbi:MAG: hypothetical protein QOD53_2359 [Thermoleophilaceae bacterium]|nr:hypothetical protein [Thermoleophilaceae bacterium]